MKRAILGLKNVLKELTAAVRAISEEPKSHFRKAPCREHGGRGPSVVYHNRFPSRYTMKGWCSPPE